MKFFGWGRRKDPPPTQPAYQELKKSDHFSDAPGRSAQSRGAERYGTRYGSETVARQEDQTPQQSATSPPRPWKCFPGEAGDGDLEIWEEKLQETIRFVFRHEQEGLLTIGTFALDQLAGVTNLDGGQNKPPATDHNSVSNMQLAILEVRSSDDEIDLPQSNLRSSIFPAPCRRNLESYPIFGDHDAPISCRVLSFGSTKPVDTGDDHLACTNNSAHAKTDHAVAGIKEVVLSTTDSEVVDKSDSEDFYSPGACTLFASRSRRTHQNSAKEKQKKPPEKRKGDGGACELKRTGSCGGSLSAQLGRLWRSGCARSHVSTKVSPEKKLTSNYMRDSQAQDLQGPPCIANVEDAAGVPKPSQASEAGKQRNGPRKRRSHSFGKGWPCAHNGKWIRTDSEYVIECKMCQWTIDIEQKCWID